jgi:thiol-disulfide isomerase/thioredoxin
MVVALLCGAAWRQANGRMRAPRARRQEGGAVTTTSAAFRGDTARPGVAPDPAGPDLPAAASRGDTAPPGVTPDPVGPEPPAIQQGNGAAPLPVATSVAALVRSAEPADQQLRLTGEQIGGALGERATLVQFSSAFCAPCRATRRILADVAGMTGGVAYVEIDAESRLDLVRRLNVLRTPTVLVLDADGGVVRRASGQPRKADVIAAVGVAAGI